MTTIGNISYAYINGTEAAEIKRIDSVREGIQNKTAYQRNMPNRSPYSYKIKSADYGIDEFGRSELIKLHGYAKSERIRRNPGAKGPLESLVFEVAKKKFVVDPREKKRKAKLLSDFMNMIEDKLEGSYRDLWIALGIPGIWYGNEIAEKESTDLPADFPKFGNKRIYKKFTPKFPGLYELKETADNNLYGIRSTVTGELFPPESFIIFQWLKMFGRNEGTAVYDSVFKYLEAKDIIYQNMLTFINKYSGLIPFVTFENPQDKDYAESLANDVYAGAGIALPKGVIVEFKNALADIKQEAFFILFNWCDSQANKAIRGTSGLSANDGSGAGTGSFAADKTKIERESVYEWYLQTYLEELWYEDICKPILAYNFDPVLFPESLYPRGKFIDEEEKTPVDVREDLQKAADLELLDFDKIDNKVMALNELKIPVTYTDEEIDKIRAEEIANIDNDNLNLDTEDNNTEETTKPGIK